MRVRLAPTSAASARRRAKATVIRLLAARGRAGREGQEPFELRPGTAGAGDLLVPANQLLELGAARGTAVLVDGHGRELRRWSVRGQGIGCWRRWRAGPHRRAGASSWDSRDETARPSPRISRGLRRSSSLVPSGTEGACPGAISGARRASRESSRRPCRVEEWWPARGERRRRCGLPLPPRATGWSSPGWRPSTIRLR